MACSPGYPELSKSYMDMASKLFTFTFTTCAHETAMVAAHRISIAIDLARIID